MANPDNHYDETGSGFSVWWIIGIILLVFGIGATFVVPGFMDPRASGKFTQCQSNCRNIGIALKMYCGDNNGEYPRTLTSLIPQYLRVIPTCAGSGTNRGYIESYRVSDDLKHCSFYCKGHNHRGGRSGQEFSPV